MNLFGEIALFDARRKQLINERCSSVEPSLDPWQFFVDGRNHAGPLRTPCAKNQQKGGRPDQPDFPLFGWISALKILLDFYDVIAAIQTRKPFGNEIPFHPLS
jgi:hypothetical protein